MLVGYYRIELSDSLRLTGADLELAQACFTKPYEVFLVIQPTGFGPPNASFFFHDKNGKMAEFSLLEFPFDPSLLAGEERERLRRSHKAAATRLAAPELSALLDSASTNSISLLSVTRPAGRAPPFLL